MGCVYHYETLFLKNTNEIQTLGQQKCKVTDLNCMLRRLLFPFQSCFFPSQTNPLSVSKVGNYRHKIFSVIPAGPGLLLPGIPRMSPSLHCQSLSPYLRLLHVEFLVSLAKDPLELQPQVPGAGLHAAGDADPLPFRGAEHLLGLGGAHRGVCRQRKCVKLES